MNDISQEKTVGRPRQFDEEHVLIAAMEVFWSKGFEATSLADLCKATGLHKGSLYQAFKDKHTLFIRALDHYSECELANTMKTISETASPLENLKAVLYNIVDISNEGNGCFMVNSLVELATHDETVKTALRKHCNMRVKALTKLIEEAQKSGEIRAELRSEKLALHLMINIAGAMTLTKGLLDKKLAIELINDLISGWR